MTGDNASLAYIRRACEASLQRLNTEYIDLYYFHHGSFGDNDKYLHGAAETMDRLAKEGKVRIKGQSAYSSDDFERVVPVVRPQVLQSWAHALDDQFIRPGSRVQNLMEKFGMTFVAFSPLAQARLLDKYDPRNPPQFEPGDHRKTEMRGEVEAVTATAPPEAARGAVAPMPKRRRTCSA